MEKFVIKDPETGEYIKDVAHYTISEVSRETGFGHQMIRREAFEGHFELVHFKHRYYLPQDAMDHFRKKSPKAVDRVGKIGTKQDEEKQISEDQIKKLL